MYSNASRERHPRESATKTTVGLPCRYCRDGKAFESKGALLNHKLEKHPKIVQALLDHRIKKYLRRAPRQAAVNLVPIRVK
jgi:hypothetical protein